MTHTPGALKAANLIARSEKLRPLVFGGILRETAAEAFAEIIDRETAAPALLEALECADSILFLLSEEISRLGLRATEVPKKVKSAIKLAKGGS